MREYGESKRKEKNEGEGKLGNDNKGRRNGST